MKSLTLKKILLPLLALAGIALTAHADIDKGFYKKASEKVWGMKLPQFNPKAELPDSIYGDKAASYIASYIKIDASYDKSVNSGKESTVGYPYRNATKAYYLQRKMVRIQQPSALEKFSEFKFDSPDTRRYRGFTISTAKYTFGAKIIKPDGREIVIDVPALAVSEKSGKKDKDSKYKIAIPGLEVGDVLDYFFYDEYDYDEVSIPSMEISFLKSYPTRDFELDITADPRLAVEYGCYNGAPRLDNSMPVDGKNHASLKLNDLTTLEEKMPFFSLARQLPVIDLHILNNEARLEFVPSPARSGGIRTVLYPQLLSDIQSCVKDIGTDDKTIGQAAGIVKDWCKVHPAATEREVIDAAYLALRYASRRNEISVGTANFCLAFAQLLDKLKINTPARLGVTSNRQKAAIDELVYFQDAIYTIVVGDTTYFATRRDLYTPGETIAHHDSEKAVFFDCPLTENAMGPYVKYYSLPASKARENTYESHIALSLDPANTENMNVEHRLNLSGAAKDLVEFITPTDDAMLPVAEFLGQKPLKRMSKKSAEEVAKDQRDEMEELIHDLWDSSDASLSEYRFEDYGNTPASRTTKLLFKGSVPGLTSSAGNDLMVNIGIFNGKKPEMKGSDRQRDIAVVKPSAALSRTEIVFTVPEGYEVVPESLEALKRNVVAKEAVFNVTASMENGKVKIGIGERFPRSTYEAASWPELLRVYDAMREFSSASILLRPI